MKDKILMILLFFLFMAAVPVGFAVGNAKKPLSSPSEKNSSESVAASTAALCREDDSDEFIRAVAVIERTNLLSGANAEAAENNSDEELYKRVERICNESETVLTLDGKAVYIPCFNCSDGYTEASRDHPYLCAVASPWDAYCADRDSEQRCEGVSLNGVRVLTQSGLSAEEALLWYLPGLQAQNNARQNKNDASS